MADERRSRLTDRLNSLREIDRLRGSNWKSLPLSVGLLVALIAGGAFIVHVVASSQRSVHDTVLREIKNHNDGWSSHEPLKQLIEARHDAQRKEIDRLTKRVERLERLLEKRRGRRR